MDNVTSAEKPKLGIETVITHPQFGRGRIIGYQEKSYMILFKGGEIRRVPFFYADLQTVEAVGDPELDLIKQAVREVLHDYGWLEADLEMGARWRGGTLEMVPGKEGAQPKTVPIEVFFKKIIGIREKLRVLEQKINNHSSLSQEEKLELEGYISRCYGSLTTFNILFSSKHSHFTSI